MSDMNAGSVAEQPAPLPYFYHLASCEVVFEQGTLRRIEKMNVVSTTKTHNITVADLSLIQAGAQKQFFENFPQFMDGSVKVTDVYIAGISSLGFMTAAEFRQAHQTVDEAPAQDNNPNQGRKPIVVEDPFQ